jgi:hypothetical protein
MTRILCKHKRKTMLPDTAVVVMHAGRNLDDHIRQPQLLLYHEEETRENLCPLSTSLATQELESLPFSRNFSWDYLTMAAIFCRHGQASSESRQRQDVS